MARGLTDAQIVERIERLERAVKALAEKAGVEIEDPSEGVDPEIVKLARAGKEMDAAKLYSERTGASFADAQRIVNDL
jgi:uncharacterized protein (UPF0335 family)